MADPTAPSRNLSEIGHLFLSSVRDRQTNGAPLPRRRPPEGPGLTLASPPPAPPPPPEVAPSVVPLQQLEIDPPPLVSEESSEMPPISVVLGAHLNGGQIERVRQYARHLAAGGQRVGLIEVDANDFRLSRFERNPTDYTEDVHADERDPDARMFADSIEEMSCDVDRWLLLLPHPRSTEARALLGQVNHWILLSTCDHDGIVGCYRTLKGARASHQPRLSLALLDARDDQEADAVFRKLASVCRQFLKAPLDFESPVKPAEEVAECVALCGRPVDGLSPTAHWNVVSEFLNRAPRTANLPIGSSSLPNAHQEIGDPGTVFETIEVPLDSEVCEPMNKTYSIPPVSQESPPPMRFTGHDQEHDTPPSVAFTDVIDLPDDQSADGSILAAVLRNESADLIECPVTPPRCSQAKLAVTRDRRLVLLAVARQGLGDLRSIGRAYNWLVENYKLICMATPQLAIDPAAKPCLRLLVDHADLSADILEPMLQSNTVTIQAYRKLRWGGKTGLLLEAA